MKPLNILEKFLDWIDEKFYYNCKKGRHKWVYLLDEDGVLRNEVPDERLFCSKCKIKKVDFKKIKK